MSRWDISVPPRPGTTALRFPDGTVATFGDLDRLSRDPLASDPAIRRHVGQLQEHAHHRHRLDRKLAKRGR